MLHQENGTHSIDGVYERERLRSMAKKLGLRLVKRRVQRAEDTDPFVAPG
jgi:transposase